MKDKSKEKKPCKSGLDFIRGPGWIPMLKTRKGWELLGRRLSKKRPAHCCTPVLFDAGSYFRLSFAGQPVK